MGCKLLKKNIPYKAILKLVDFLFVLLASNPAAERFFYIFNNIWFSEFQMGLETLETLLKIKCNFETDCSGFLSNRPNT